MRVVIGAFAGLLLSAPPVSAVETYDQCLELIAKDPRQAEREAGDWARFGGGGASARHCYALALIEIGAPSKAIDELLGIAAEEASLTDPARADVLVQAGEMLLDEGDDVTAGVVAEQALRLAPRNGAVLALRAAVRIARGAYRDALTDLNEAINRDGPLPRLLLLRASAHRQSGALIEARDDATYATELEPRMAEAWLERGRIEARIKDRDNARDSLLEAIALDRDGDIGKTAQNVLQRMEAGID